MTTNIFPDIVEGPLWILTADRKLSDEELLELNRRFSIFFSEWNAHGNRVTAASTMLDKRVLMVAADSQACDVSGCSKDKLYYFVKEVGAAFGIDFFNRMLIPIIQGSEVGIIHWNDIQSKIEAGELLDSVLFIDATVTTLSAFRLSGLQPLSNLLVSL